MKKFVSMLVAMMLVLSMATASAAVVSKTTTDTTVVQKVETSTNVEVKETFEVKVTENAEPVVKQITQLYKFVTEEEQPVIEFFPEETKAEIKQVVAAKVAEKILEMPELAGLTIDVEKMELNEFVTVEAIDYEEEYGDITVNFTFLTEYQPDQIVVALVSLFNGEVDEEDNPVVEWLVVDAVVLEDGSLDVVFTQEEMVKIQDAQTVALAVLSEAAEAEEIIAEQN